VTRKWCELAYAEKFLPHAISWWWLKSVKAENIGVIIRKGAGIAVVFFYVLAGK